MKVLLTGGSGFVGSHCLDLLLKEKYVKDVSLAHIRAVTLSEAAGKRFLLCQGKISNAEIARVAIAEFPELKDKVPEVLESDEPADPFGVDSSQSKEILGIEYRWLRESIVDTINALKRAGQGVL